MISLIISGFSGLRAHYLKREYMRQGLQFKIRPYSSLSFGQIRKATADPDNHPYLLLLERLRKAHVFHLVSFYITIILVVLSFIVT